MKTTGTNNLISRFETLRPRLKIWASRFLGDDTEADDALQEAFVRLWRHKEEISDGSATTIDSVSMTAVRSACIDATRRRKVRQAEPIEAADTYTGDETDSATELAEEIKALMADRLDSRAREIMLLHDSLGYDYDEIAQRLGITEAHTRVILSRARKAVRDAYRERLR